MKRVRTWPDEQRHAKLRQRHSNEQVRSRSGRHTRKFTPKPLKDGKNEIRLLQMQRGGNEKDDCLRYSIKTESFKRAKDFIAISYTWGSTENQQTVFIDNMEQDVRRNCHYVLKQTYRYWELGQLQSDFVWIDSICINQDDNAEKALQVAFMGEIYSRAGLVIACVGPHADDSEFLVAKARETADLKYDCKAMLGGDFMCRDCQSPWEAWTLSLGAKSLTRLSNACQAFARREYWTRIWIIQEVAKASSLQVLCGDDMLPWTALHNLEDFLTMEMEEIKSLFKKYRSLPSLDSYEMHQVFRAKKDKVPIDEVFTRFSGSKCFHPRDRVYGLLSLIESPTDRAAILPNYTAPTFEVAVQMQHLFSFQRIPELVGAFGITPVDKQVRRLVDQRRGTGACEALPHVVGVTADFKPMHQSEHNSDNVPMLCGRIGLGNDGEFTATLFKKYTKGYKVPQSPTDSSDWLDNLSEASSNVEEKLHLQEDIDSFLSSVPSEIRPRVIMHQSEVAGFVCNTSRQDDILVPIRQWNSGAVLVLRQNTEEIFDIVGQAVLLEGYSFGCHPDAYDDHVEVPLFTAKVEIKITAENAVLLFAQDGLDLYEHDPDYENKGEVEDPWGRALTSVGGEQSGAVRLTMQTPMLAKDVLVGTRSMDSRARAEFKAMLDGSGLDDGSDGYGWSVRPVAKDTIA